MKPMFLTIITPCSRVGNLERIAASINVPRHQYRWIVVVDGDRPPEPWAPPSTAETFYHQNPRSRWGNAQRNMALSLVQDGWVLFLDDDTVLHPELWTVISELNNDFIQFNQEWADGRHRLGGLVRLNHVDSGNVIIHSQLIQDSRWALDRRNADGVFIVECFSRAKNPVYVKKTLSTYNALR